MMCSTLLIFLFLLGGDFYFVTQVDDFSHIVILHFLKYKSELLDKDF